MSEIRKSLDGPASRFAGSETDLGICCRRRINTAMCLNNCSTRKYPWPCCTGKRNSSEGVVTRIQTRQSRNNGRFLVEARDILYKP